jgi:hypothetical protein
MTDAHTRVQGFTGFHEFAEFMAEDVGTVLDSGKQVLLLLNELTSGK